MNTESMSLKEYKAYLDSTVAFMEMWQSCYYIHKKYNPNSTPLNNSYFGDYPKITFSPIESTKNGILALIWSMIFILIIRQIFLLYLT
jgi:hypothetical protein